MEPGEVRTAIARVVGQLEDLHSFDHLPSSIDPPTFVAGEVEIDYDQVEEGGFDEFRVTGHLYASTADDEAGQRTLDRYLSPRGPYSIKALLEADRTLGGLVTTLRVERVRGYSRYQIADDQARFFGAKLTIRVWGV